MCDGRWVKCHDVCSEICHMCDMCDMSDMSDMCDVICLVDGLDVSGCVWMCLDVRMCDVHC